jgi:CRISPR-associated protein Cmr1
MKRLEYQITFNTPAFLGNAEQNGQWRTPPFKALLRQWWRMAYAADFSFNVNLSEMRREEGLLFGNAWLSHRDGSREVADHCRSRVRIRLDSWRPGELKSWPARDSAVSHPEVQRPVGSQLYLGYGPLTFRSGTALKANAAIQAGENATLSIAVPEEHLARIERSLWLIDHYGTVGGRSRNAWGSFSLTSVNGTPKLTAGLPVRPWREALRLGWPHAIGQDDKGAVLVWQTNPNNDWKALMRELAIVKIGLRTQFLFSSKGPHATVQPRHWLSYPITSHSAAAWRDARLPNSLRFKVRPDPRDSSKFVGIMFHVPCLPPSEFKPNTNAITQTWQSVHALLDELTRPGRSRTYASISDAARRAKLKDQLNEVTLTRIAE